MKAREWLRRGEISKDPFDALSNFWRGFNNLFAGNGRERELIKTYLRENIDESFAQILIDSNTKDVHVLISQPVIDMRGNGRDTSRYIREFQNATASVDRLVALFLVIYQVRCNFEHGQKSPSRSRDQALCQAACPFVSVVVGHAAQQENTADH